MSITEFLEARIAEDEDLARKVIATVAPDEWENPTKWGNFYAEDIAFWDSMTPHRILAECAAKRAIVEYFSLEAEQLEDPRKRQRASDMEWNLMRAGGDTLRALAAVYKDHPDYRQEWGQ